MGGDVIVAIDGQSTRTFEDLLAYLFSHTAPDQKVTLTILRDGQQKQVDLTLGERPSQEA